jgi:hypothetical protein
MQASRSVKVLAPPPRRCASSGRSARIAVLCTKNVAVITMASFIRRLSRTYVQPSRIAPMKRSPGRTDGGFSGRRQR